MVGVMKCFNCGKIVHLSNEQFELVKEMWEVFGSIERITNDMKRTGIDISFDHITELRAMNNFTKCCDNTFLLYETD